MVMTSLELRDLPLLVLPVPVHQPSRKLIKSFFEDVIRSKVVLLLLEEDLFPWTPYFRTRNVCHSIDLLVYILDERDTLSGVVDQEKV